MNWLQTIAVVLHVLLALGIVGLVLLQRGKGADAGAGFGAGASGTVFGARGSASFLSRTTAVLATLFFLTSLGLSYLYTRQKQPTSVMDTTPAPATLPAPKQTLPIMPSPQGSAPAPNSTTTAPASEPPAPAAPTPAPAQQQPAPSGTK